ncbi:MAG: hypothetical protein M0Z49_10270 [Chloroflexi bacterium]|nr:hypothetical protein [Chloroflexota bacterium]
MQHSLAPGRSARLMPRFVAPSDHGREARLGLHRMAPGLTTGATSPSRGRRMGLRDRRGMTVEAPRLPSSGVLRREPRLHWATDFSPRNASGTLRAAPWRR